MKKADDYNFFILYKMSKTTYYQKIREIVLNRAREYCENNKEVLREKERGKYRQLSKKEKDIKRK